MNSNKANPSGGDATGGLPTSAESPTPPAFGCVVYLSERDGAVRARVANLAGIEASAGDQRQVLGQIVASFKTQVAACLEAGQAPEWIEPPLEKRSDERKLFLPVHL